MELAAKGAGRAREGFLMRLWVRRSPYVDEARVGASLALAFG